MPRKAIVSSSVSSIGPYSHAVDTGESVFLSGQIAIDPLTGELVSKKFSEQATYCFKNRFTTLKEIGLAPGDVQKVNVYLTNMDDFSEMNGTFERQFKLPYPARITVGVASLPKGARASIESIALKPR